MSLDWNRIKPEHVTRACELVMIGEYAPRARAKGIFVIFRDQRLPAKHVLRLACLLANGMPLNSKLRFSSGDGTIGRLRRLGFNAERFDPAREVG